MVSAGRGITPTSPQLLAECDNYYAYSNHAQNIIADVATMDQAACGQGKGKGVKMATRDLDCLRIRLLYAMSRITSFFVQEFHDSHGWKSLNGITGHHILSVC